MTDPIDGLLAEHREIMAEVEALRRAVRELEARGDAALPGARPRLASVAHMMGTRLLRHARKEDEALFPALEQAFGTLMGPTAVMREEHRMIHERAGLFRETLTQLDQVEHPAIVAGGARLGTLSGTADAATLARVGAEILALLDAHFGKEEQILFPMAREILGPEVLRAVAERIATIEAEAA